MARSLVLTGLWLSLIFFGFALFVHNRLYDKDLGRAAELESALREALGPAVDLSAAPILAGSPGLPPGPGPGQSPGQSPARSAGESLGVDPLERLLGQSPATAPTAAGDPGESEAGKLAAVFYGDAEWSRFETAVALGPFERPTSPAATLVPPQTVMAGFADAAVTLSWVAGTRNELLASSLAAEGAERRLAFRVYRAQDLAEPELMVTLPFGLTMWRDLDLPLGQARLTYEVWTVLLRSALDQDVLVAAERSEPVLVETPDRFTLALREANPETAQFELRLHGLGNQTPLRVHARVGEELFAGDLSTGLRLQSLHQAPEQVLGIRRRWIFTPDGGLVLDPVTNQPRTTETQVLMPVTRWTAILGDSEGRARLSLSLDQS